MSPSLPFLEGGGACAALIAARDWSATLGAPETWVQALRTATSILLRSPVPMVMLWGEDGVMIYNDAYSVFAGGRHPGLLGSKVREGWPEVADFNDHVMRVGLAGGTLAYRDQELTLYRHGRPEQVWMNLDYSPVPGEDGRPAGVLAVVVETTAVVAAQRALSEARAKAEAESAQGAAILGQLAEGVIVADADGRITFVNAAAARLHGVDRLEVSPEAYSATYHLFTEEGEPYPSKQLPLSRAVLDGETVSDARWRIRRPDGTEVLAVGSACPVLGPEGQRLGAVLTLRDDTERDRAAKALGASEARLRGVLEGMGEAFGLMDRDFVILDQNPEAMRLDGRPREAIIGRSHWEVYPGSEDGPLGRLYKRAMAERVPVAHEHRQEWGDGRTTWLDMRAYPVPEGLAVFWRDITERKEAEARLQESEARARAQAEELAAIYNASPVGLTVLDTDLRYVRINDQLAEINGLPAADHIGRTVREVVPDLEEQALEVFRSVLGGETLLGVEFTGETPAQPGVRRTWRENWVPLRGAGGEVAGIIISAEEVTEAKEAEALLRESEARFRNMADHAPVMMWVTDGTGACTYLNRSWYEFTGQAEAEALGLGWLEAVHPDDRAESGRIFLDATERQAPFRLEYRLRRADGTWRWAIDAAAPRIGPEGEFLGFIGSVIDISDRKVAEEELRGAEERYRTLFESIESGFCIVEVDLGGAEGRIDYRVIEANPAFYRQTGFPQAILGLWLREAAPGLEEHWFETYGRVARTGEPARFEQGSDLLGRWFDVYAFRMGQPGAGRVAILFTDISVRRQAELTLKEFNAELERRVAEVLAERTALARIVETTGAMVQALDLDYRWTAINLSAAEAFERLFGRRPRVGDSLRDLLADRPEDWAQAQALWDRALAGESFSSVAEWGGSGPERRILEMRFEVLRDGDGAVTGAFLTGMDATDRVLAEARLRETEDALRQSQKMEAVGHLTGGIAHDFNNMLAAVVGSLDLLGRRIGENDPRGRRYVEAAMEGARRAATLTQRLLAFSRQQPLRPEALDVNRLVQGMSDLVQRSLGAGVRLETVLAGGLWRAHADPNQLENVILNLAVNARDAMAEGGRLTIETVNAHLDSRYAADHLGLPPGQYVQVAVTDTGSGMTPEVAARAFDPFFTTKPVGRGTGLGLSQVYGFVKQSGGHVKLYSEPGQGTTVKIYLPRLLAEQDEEVAAASPRDLPRGEAEEVILVVEDEPMVRQFTVDALTELGYRVIEADGAAAALRLLDRHPEVALLFTDIVMPETNGRKLADEALRRRPGLRVLFTTGYTRNAVVHNGVLDPGTHLIGKPFTVEALAAKLREVLEEARD